MSTENKVKLVSVESPYNALLPWNQPFARQVSWSNESPSQPFGHLSKLSDFFNFLLDFLRRFLT